MAQQIMTIDADEIDLLCNSLSRILNKDGVTYVELKTSFAVNRIEISTLQNFEIKTAYRPGQWKSWSIQAGEHLIYTRPEVIRYIEIRPQIDNECKVLHIFASSGAILLSEFKDRFKLNPSFLQNHGVHGSAPISTLRVEYIGALGNYVAQIINVIAIARRCGAKQIELFDQGTITVPRDTEYEGIHVIQYRPDTDPVKPGTLYGPFLRRSQFGSLLSGLTGDEAQCCVRKFIRPNLMRSLDSVRDQKSAEEVTLHLRAGDVFQSGFAGGHGQPPLAFYRIALLEIMSEYFLKSVRLVFQDNGNPIVDEIQNFLTKEGIEFRCQCSSEIEDLAALVDAKHLIVGFSGYVHVAALLSNKIVSLSYFEHQHDFSFDFRSIPTIETCRVYHDTYGAYPHPREWRNTASDRARLIHYPSIGIARCLDGNYSAPTSKKILPPYCSYSYGWARSGSNYWVVSIPRQIDPWIILAFEDDHSIVAIDLDCSGSVALGGNVQIRSSQNLLRWEDILDTSVTTTPIYLRCLTKARYLHFQFVGSYLDISARIQIVGEPLWIKTKWGYYDSKTKTFATVHNAGLFSQVIVAVIDILYLLSRGFEIEFLDTNRSYSLYRDARIGEIHSTYFELDLSAKLPQLNQTAVNDSAFNMYGSEPPESILKWFIEIDYNKIPYEYTGMIINKFFRVNSESRRRATAALAKVHSDLSNCICIYFRGTDKSRETPSARPDDLIAYALSLLMDNSLLSVFVQSDDGHVLHYIKRTLGCRAFSFDEMPTSWDQTPIHRRPEGSRVEETLDFLAAFDCMYRCRYVLCSISNVSTALALYRGRPDGMVFFDQSGVTADFISHARDHDEGHTSH